MDADPKNKNQNELARKTGPAGSSAAYLAGMVDYIPDALIAVDSERNVVGWNKAAERIYGWSAAEVLGQPLEDFVQTRYDNTDVSTAIADAMQTGHWSGDVTQMRKDGTRFPVWSSVTAVRAGDGSLIGYTGINRDLSERKQAEEALRRKKEELEKLLEILPAAVWIAEDPDCTVVHGNRLASELLGVSDESNVSQSVQEPDIRVRHFAHGQELAPEDLPLQSAARTGRSSFNVDVRIEGRGIPDRYFIGGAAPLFDEGGQPRGAVSVFHEVSERRAAEVQYRQLFENMQEVFFLCEVLTDSQGRAVDLLYLDANPACLQRARRKYDETVGHTYRELFPPNPTFEIWLEHFGRVAATGQPERFEQFAQATGLYFDVSAHSPHRGRVAVVMTDITAYRQTEKKLIQMKRLYATLSQVNQTIVQVKDRQELYQAICNLAMQYGELKLAWIGLLDEASGEIRPAAAAGMDVNHWPLPIANIRGGPYQNGVISSAIRSGSVIASEDVLQDPRVVGAQAIIHKYGFRAVAAIPFRQRGRVIGVLSLISAESGYFKNEEELHLLEEMSLDISFAIDTLEAEAERSAVVEALQHSEERYRLISENTSDVIWALDPLAGRFTFVSPSVERLRGYTPREVMAQPIEASLTPESQKLVAETLAVHLPAFLKQGRGTLTFTNEVDQPHKNGSIVHTEVTTNYVFNPQGRVEIIGVSRDITARKQADADILAGRAKLEAALESMTDAVFISDTQGNFIDFNEAFATFHKFQNKTECARTLAEYPDFLDMYMNTGELAPLEMWAVPRALRGETATNAEYTLHRRDTGETWVGSYSFAPIRDAAGNITGSVVVGRDITARKQAEQDLQHRNQDLSLINALNEAANRGDDLAAVTETFARLARSMFACQDAAIYLVGVDGRSLELLNTTLAPDITMRIERLIGRPLPRVHIPLQEGSLVNTVLNAGKGLLVDDAQWIQDWIAEFTRTTFLPGFLQEPIRMMVPAIHKILGIQSIMCVPLQSPGRTIGLLELSSRGQFNPADLERVQSLSRQITAAILRKQAEAQVEMHLQRISSLHEIDRAIGSSLDMHLSLDFLVSEVLVRLKVDAAAVMLLNPARQTLEYVAGKGFRSLKARRWNIPLGEDLSGRVALSRKLLHIPSLPESGIELVRPELVGVEQFVEYYGIPLTAKGILKGVLEIFHRSPLVKDPEWANFLETLGGQAAIAIDNAQLFESIQRANLELITAYDATIAGWSQAMDLRDRETQDHTNRLVENTLQLARRMGLPAAEQVHIRRGALLHDIGKLGVPDHILSKPGPLTGDEWVEMRQHPVYAFQMLASIAYLRPALEIPYCHHERWDGSGYPRGLKGEQIPLSARLFAVVDVWDALTHDRPYRPAWTPAATRQYIIEQSGRQFDPQVVALFFSMLDEEKQQ